MLKLVLAQGVAQVQDLGRAGWQAHGVPVGGVLDPFSLQIANLALGNPPESAAIEMAGRFEFVCTQATSVMLATAGACALLHGKRWHAGQRIALQEGDLLAIYPSGPALWCTLAVQGGVDVPLVLGSRATCAAAGFGGYLGRKLQKGDVLHCAAVAMPSQYGLLSPDVRLKMPSPWWGLQGGQTGQAEELPLACLPGAQWSMLTPGEQTAFLQTRFEVTAQSSRMGYRLAGQVPFSAFKAVSIASQPVYPGVVQCPPDGHPMLLLADCQVSGGYPALLSLASAELWKLAHVCPGHVLRFNMIGLDAAASLQASQARQFAFYQDTIAEHATEC